MSGMVIRCLIYLAAVLLSLSAFAVGLVEVLFRSQVRPKLDANRAAQDKVYQAYLDDLHYLDRFPLLKHARSGSMDAGVFLNPKVYWAPRNPARVVEGKGAAQTLVPIQVREDLMRLRGDWIRKYNRVKTIHADLSVFTGLSRFDYWDIEQGSPIAQLAEEGIFVPPAELPVPDSTDLLAAVKLRLMTAALNRDFLLALQDVRDLARLLLTTENTQLMLAGLVALDHERSAYRFYVDDLKMPAEAWTPVDRNLTRRAHRAILATRSLLHVWTKEDKIQTVFLSEAMPTGLCAAANESFPMIFSLRKLLEPHWPFEMSLRDEYAQLQSVWRMTSTHCRVRYLTALNDGDHFSARIPGPLLLNRLPYSRKIFGLRISLLNFAGFDDYRTAPSAL